MNVTIVCQGFSNSSIHLQPWRHISEVSRRMKAKGIKVTILADRAKGSPVNERVGDIDVLHMDHLILSPFINRKGLLAVLKKNEPDVIIWYGRPLSCMCLAQLKAIKKPIVWNVDSGAPSLRDILKLSLREIMSRHHRFLWVEVLNALFPRFLIRKIANSSLVKKIIVPSRHLKSSFLQIGVLPKKIVVLPSTLDKHKRKLCLTSSDTYKSESGFKDKNFIITYMGSPCTLRGSDTVIRSIPYILRKERIDLRCLILSRRPMEKNENHLKNEENYLRGLTEKLKLKDIVEIIPGILGRDEILQFMQVSDVIVLPFKLLFSQVPLSVLEAMELGKIVVTTKVGMLHEIVGQDRGILIEPSDPYRLAEAILQTANNLNVAEKIKRNAQSFTAALPSWDDIADRTISILEETIG